MTLEKLIAWGWIENIKDIFVLKEHRDEWIKKPEFGVASVDKILNSIEESRHCETTTFITSLGIPLIGNSVAKSLMSHYFDYWDFRKAVEEKFDFSKFDGFAESKTLALWKFNYEEADEIYKNYIYSDFVTVIKDNITEDTVKNCDGLKFVITGKVSHYKNRDELKSIIESRGGKVIDSVSKNTNYLINNDVNSTTGKNQTAKKLNVPIISEEEFIKKFIENM
jgi:DNA ligase (NAD+)